LNSNPQAARTEPVGQAGDCAGCRRHRSRTARRSCSIRAPRRWNSPSCCAGSKFGPSSPTPCPSAQLQYDRQIEVLLLGGYLRASSPDLVGQLRKRTWRPCGPMRLFGRRRNRSPTAASTRVARGRPDVDENGGLGRAGVRRCRRLEAGQEPCAFAGSKTGPRSLPTPRPIVRHWRPLRKAGVRCSGRIDALLNVKGAMHEADCSSGKRCRGNAPHCGRGRNAAIRAPPRPQCAGVSQRMSIFVTRPLDSASRNV